MDDGGHTEIARAESPRGEVVLRERRSPSASSVIELRVNGTFVMDTHETSSERALADVALAQVVDPRNVLIGGLGLGFTLQQVLADTRVERVVVMELEEVLIGWMRDGTVPHGPALLADRRVRLTHVDVLAGIEETASSTYDLVLLDVDNGPEGLVHAGNASIYSARFLGKVRRALTDTGVVVVWSATESTSLDAALGSVFGHTSTLSYAVDLQGRQETYWLHVAHQ